MITSFFRPAVSRALLAALLALAALATAPRASASGYTLTGNPFGQENVHAGAVLLPNGTVLLAGGTLTESAPQPVVAAQLYDPLTATWTPTANLLTPRERHTMTLLQDGTVLVTGGFDGTNLLSSTEIYDPATGAWRAGPAMKVARSNHTATLLQDGRVFVFGAGTGEIYDPNLGTWTSTHAPLAASSTFAAAVLLPNGEVLVIDGADGSPDAEIYDPGFDIWTATAGLVNAHVQGTLTVLATGSVLLAGGQNLIPAGGQAPPSAEIYDPGVNQWSTTGDMHTPRVFHSASLLPSGQVLVVGGSASFIGFPGPTLDSAELYDPATGMWSGGGTPTAARASHTATLLPTGKLLLVTGTDDGDSNAELYDPANPAFAGTGQTRLARTQQTLTLLPNGKVLIAGGTDDNGNGIAQCELYDPATGGWSDTGLLHATRLGHTATLLASGKVLIAGGFTPNTAQFVSSSEVYDPANGQWTVTTGAPMFGHVLHTATLLPSGQVLLAGGTVEGGNDTDAELYDPATDAWIQTGPIDRRRVAASATLLPNGRVFLAGGATDTDPVTNTVTVYDPLSGAWSPATQMGEPREYQSATLLPNGRVLVTGGVDLNGIPLKTAELYNPSLDQWTPAHDMQAPRYLSTATLLLNGQVLLTGGNATATSEVYDPSIDQWTAGPVLTGNRRGQSAALLGTSKVLVVGGIVDSHATTGSVLFDPGFSYDNVPRPVIIGTTAPLLSGSTFSASGSGFTGPGGASTGTTLDSSSNYPVAQLQSLANEQVLTLPIVFHSIDTFITAPIYGFPAGYARLTVFVNGVPSTAAFVQVAPGAPGVFTDLTGDPTNSSVPIFAKVVAGASPTTVFFEYGTDPQLATFSTTPRQFLAPSSMQATILNTLTGLSAHTTYYYRVVAKNAAGTFLGGIQSVGTLNTVPTATDGTASLAAGSPQVLTLPFATPDADGDAVTIQTLTSQHATVQNKSGNQVTLLYPLQFSGMDQVVYTVSDGAGGTGDGTVTVTVTSPAPTAVADAFFTGAGASTALSLDVLANDLSANTASLKVVDVSRPQFGAVKIAMDGKSIVYTPRVAFSTVSATDTFTYTVQDVTGLQSTATVKVNNPSNLLKGTFDGLVGNGANVGYVSVTLTANGSFTGKLRIGTAALSNFKGTLRLDGSADVMAGTTSVHVALDPTTGVITATIMQGANFYGAQLERESYNATLAPAPQAGKYTALIPRDTSGPNSTQATATATVNSGGLLASVTVTNGGTGYTIPPLVTITSPQGSGATAVATILNGVVTGVTITKPGAKYPASGVTVTIDPEQGSRPAGAGYATISVAASGAATVAGKLGDGTGFSASGFVKSDGSLALFTTLAYKKVGTLLGTLQFQDIPGESDCIGALVWNKPAQTTAQRYQAGFSTAPGLAGSRYLAPARGENAFNFAQEALTGLDFGAVEGDLPNPPNRIDDVISISTASVVKETASPTADKLTLKINPASGLVTGTFTPTLFVAPTGPKKVTVALTGVVIQKLGIAGGYFLGPQHSGIFSFPGGN